MKYNIELYYMIFKIQIYLIFEFFRKYEFSKFLNLFTTSSKFFEEIRGAEKQTR